MQELTKNGYYKKHLWGITSWACKSRRSVCGGCMISCFLWFFQEFQGLIVSCAVDQEQMKESVNKTYYPAPLSHSSIIWPRGTKIGEGACLRIGTIWIESGDVWYDKIAIKRHIPLKVAMFLTDHAVNNAFTFIGQATFVISYGQTL